MTNTEQLPPADQPPAAAANDPRPATFVGRLAVCVLGLALDFRQHISS